MEKIMKSTDINLIAACAQQLQSLETFWSAVSRPAKGYDTTHLSIMKAAHLHYGPESRDQVFEVKIPNDAIKDLIKQQISLIKHKMRDLGVQFPEDQEKPIDGILA